MPRPPTRRSPHRATSCGFRSGSRRSATCLPISKPHSSVRASRRRASVPSAAVRARAAQHDVVRGHLVSGLLLDRRNRALEWGVVERLDLAAAVADEVVVVLVPGPDGLVAGDAVA